MPNEKTLLSEALLKAAFETRWQRICKRSNKFGIAWPDREALWRKLLTKYHTNFRCAYCGKPLMIKDSKPPYSRSFSIDHKVSMHQKGDNSIDNLEVICHTCNVVKGTMCHDTFIEFLNICPPELRDKMFKEMWPGRLADTIERQEMIA